MQDDMHGNMGPMMAKMKGGAAAKWRALYSTPMKTFVIANVVVVAAIGHANVQTKATTRVIRQKLVDAQGVLAASAIATSRAQASARNSQGAS